jgi:hypothetical protein
VNSAKARAVLSSPYLPSYGSEASGGGALRKCCGINALKLVHVMEPQSAAGGGDRMRNDVQVSAPARLVLTMHTMLDGTSLGMAREQTARRTVLRLL